MEEEDHRRNRLEMLDTEAVSFSPSFNSYASRRYAEIASRVINEKNPMETSGDFDDDFEFAYVTSDFDVTADEILPIFKGDFLRRNDRDPSNVKKPIEFTLIRPLEQLLLDDDSDDECDPPSSSTGTYRVWRPQLVEESPSRRKKSNSSGSASSSKQLNLRDLLLIRGSSPEGTEDALVILTSKKLGKQGRVETPKPGKAKAKGVAGEDEDEDEQCYGQNRARKEGEKRNKSRKGFFANVRAFRKTVPPS